MANPVNTADLILENVLRSRFIRAAKTFSNTSAPWTNLFTTPGTPPTSALAVSTSTAIVDPYGTFAKLYACTTANSTHFIGSSNLTTAIVSGQTYQTEIYVKDDGSHKYIQTRLKANNSGGTVNKFLQYDFNISAGTAVLSQSDAGWSNYSLNITAIGNGWWKLVLGGAFTVGTAETTVSSAYFIASSTNVQSFAGDGTTGAYIYAPQAYLNQVVDEVIGDQYSDVNGTQYRWNGYAWFIAASSGKTIVLVSSTQYFTFDGTGVLAPSGQYVRLSINRQNSTAACTWSTSPTVTLYDSATAGSVTTSGDIVFLRAADFSTNVAVAITASVAETVAITDTTTIVKLQNGSNNTVCFLTNEAAVVAAASDGTGYTLTGSGGTFKVYSGLTDVTTSSNFGVNTVGTATATQNGLVLTANTTTGIYSLSGGSWTSDQEIFNLVATYGGTNLSKTFKISKSKAGVTGAVGPSSTTAILSNDSVSIPCDSSGTPTAYGTSSTDIYVYEGNTYYTYVTSATANGQFSIATTASGITVGSIAASGSGTTRAVVGTASAMTTNPATITFTITAKRLDGTVVTLTKIQTFAKSIAGPTGITGTRGTITTAKDISPATAWADTLAATAITAAGGVSPIQGDVVTEYNSTASPAFSVTKVFSSGATWTPLTAFFGGDVIVDRSLTAAKIVTGAITTNELAANAVTAAKIAAGTITTDRIQVGAVSALYSASNSYTYSTFTSVAATGSITSSLNTFTATGSAAPVIINGQIVITISVTTPTGVPVAAYLNTSLYLNSVTATNYMSGSNTSQYFPLYQQNATSYTTILTAPASGYSTAAVTGSNSLKLFWNLTILGTNGGSFLTGITCVNITVTIGSEIYTLENKV